MPKNKRKLIAITPGTDEIKKTVSSLQRSLRTDPGLAEKFRTHPRAVLGALGLNEDLQSQLLHEAGIVVEREGCWFTCIFTCEFSCIFTTITINLPARE